MSSTEKQQYQQELLRGLELAEYIVCFVTKRFVTRLSFKGGWREVSAREVFTKLYNEPVPTF